MSEEARTTALGERLFGRAEDGVYAVLDGASIAGLRQRLHQDAPEHVCLYRGELGEDLLETAPYLVALRRGSAFTAWLLQEGWGKHWGVFARSTADLGVVRRHFRTFLMVRDPGGRRLYFRYYDPRVLRVYLPTCNAEEAALVFGPIRAYLVEGEEPTQMLRFVPERGTVRREVLTLGRGGGNPGRLRRPDPEAAAATPP